MQKGNGVNMGSRHFFVFGKFWFVSISLVAFLSLAHHACCCIVWNLNKWIQAKVRLATI